VVMRTFLLKSTNGLTESSYSLWYLVSMASSLAPLPTAPASMSVTSLRPREIFE